MKAFFTNGTYDYLQQLKDKNNAILILHTDEKAMAYEENETETMFESPRSYEIVVESGVLTEKGFIVMNNIPVTDEGRPIFETQFKKRAGMIDNAEGFQAMRVLRPERGNTYIVLVEWDNKEAYLKWKDSKSFADAHKKKDGDKKPPYSAGPAYATEFEVGEKEEE
ncbi:antibiotic biosynthesis monooxygenase family protein [Saliterribacillus persicus]|uniref:Heme-degrading monooxygenase HmoA n=1 Tax=Saliterribacillus persicus TaxID=930114 RepID=A0A368XNY4_9BACI|nr:antibiotic biosynthesis monooxygenase [Saliterribacillus persicus]RCW69673.1 heme-degrading monooxygenase HmoA [Saliterribacillus persicus]